jgi:hypothetical protein
VQRILQDTADTQEGDDKQVSALVVDRLANDHAQKNELFKRKITKNDKQ